MKKSAGDEPADLLDAPICLPRDKPSEDIFPRQWLRHAGEESRDQDEPSGPEMENYFFSTIASDLNTCSSGLMPSSVDDITAMILWSLPTTKVTRSMKP